MPGMNGFEFASKVTKESRWSSTPIVALSSFSNPKDLARGREAGFRDYVAKTDRDALLSTLHDTLAELRGDRKEHTSELQSLMRISYAVFCLKKKTHNATHNTIIYTN